MYIIRKTTQSEEGLSDYNITKYILLCYYDTTDTSNLFYYIIGISTIGSRLNSIF